MKLVTIKIVYPGEFTAEVVERRADATSDNEILEDVFAGWNHGSQRECKTFLNSRVRSLSVNDIVVVDGQPYQCAGMGWQPVSSSFVADLESQVKSHPLFPEHGAWASLSQIMWETSRKQTV
jgi:hypothetical protein